MKTRDHKVLISQELVVLHYWVNEQPWSNHSPIQSSSILGQTHFFLHLNNNGLNALVILNHELLMMAFYLPCTSTLNRGLHFFKDLTIPSFFSILKSLQIIPQEFYVKLIFYYSPWLPLELLSFILFRSDGEVCLSVRLNLFCFYFHKIYQL